MNMVRSGDKSPRFFWSVTVLSALFLFAGALSAHAASDLVGYWNFDEATGTTAADSSGNGNTGTLIGAVTHATDLPTTSCFINTHSLSFNGTGGYVSIPDNPTMDPANAITISFWMKANTVSNGRRRHPGALHRRNAG